MSRPSKGVLLINLGTPDSPSVGDVWRYLREFLMDGRVLDIPVFGRWLLVNLRIAPFRAPASSRIYRELWTPGGSPLKIYGHKVVDLLQTSLGGDYHVALGMRYKNPSVHSALEHFKNKGFSELTVIPLYPQYASASTGSTVEKVMDDIKTWNVIPSVRCVNQFCEHPLFVNAFAEIGRRRLQKYPYEHILFSYHGLPERQIRKASCENYCRLNDTCCSAYHSRNRWCYRAQCFQTSRLLAKALGISGDKYTVCFQSRLGRDPWIKPYTDHILKDLRTRGVKSVLAFSLSFVADCLETTVEIGMEYRKLFMDAGGERWDLAESLNDSPAWVECLVNLVRSQSHKVTKSQG